MTPADSFNHRVTRLLDRLRPAERRVARFFQHNREEVLIASAAALASQTGASDATVIRTVQALGFTGLADLRRFLAEELRADISPAGRVARTLEIVGGDLDASFETAIEISRQSIEELRRGIQPQDFRAAVRAIAAAGRIFAFGIGPSSAIASYFTIQLGRFGFDAEPLTDTGLLLADGLQKLGEGDLVFIFAYDRVYRELSVLLDLIERRAAASVLVTDSLAAKLGSRVDIVLTAARGRSGLLSMHTATLALVEALLIGAAVEMPDKTIASLKALNELRAALGGKAMQLPV